MLNKLNAYLWDLNKDLWGGIATGIEEPFRADDSPGDSKKTNGKGKPSDSSGQPTKRREPKPLVENAEPCAPPDSFPALESLIGNKRANRRMWRAAHDAWTQSLRSAAGFSCAFIGPASSGKTEHARRFAESIAVPFVELHPHELADIGDIYVKIRTVVDGAKIKNPVTRKTEKFNCRDLEFDGGIPVKVMLPPCVVFMDEVHGLRPKIVQGGLLKACEHSDRQMVTDDGIVINTTHVCWMIATTERGKIFDAFDTRFVKIPLRLYSQRETEQIVRAKYPDLPPAAAQMTAHYCHAVPREAMAFARELMSERKISGKDWASCAATVAEDNGIDPHGMTYQRLRILESLGQGPIPRNRLAAHVNVKALELDRFVLPPLQEVTPDQTEPLISVCSKGYHITHAGLAELDKRGIVHRGVEAFPKSMRPEPQKTEQQNPETDGPIPEFRRKA